MEMFHKKVWFEIVSHGQSFLNFMFELLELLHTFHISDVSIYLMFYNGGVISFTYT